MSFPTPRREPVTDRMRDLLDSDPLKLVLSILILLSVMPQLEAYALLFFGVFAVELLLRFWVVRIELHNGRIDRLELLLLALDLLATLSFLPWDALLDVRVLRLARLSRMLMLLGYWEPVVREIWTILTKRERSYQLLFVASAAAILVLCTAILLYHFRSFGVDFNEDGRIDRAPGFWSVAWWAFRQVQDPGNLLKDAQVSLAFVFSLVLTLAGTFIVAFLIGIGTTVVEELVAMGREQRIGIRNHSVIVNLSPHSQVLVEELVRYYAKSLRAPRIVTMGAAPTRYDFLYGEQLRRVRYRAGSPTSEHDLTKVDADRARRVILLGQAENPSSDAEIVSQILAVRDVNPECLILAELFDATNVSAAIAAGENTVPVLSYHFLARLIAHIITHDRSSQVFDELLSSRGHEVYTCIYGSGAMSKDGTPGELPSFATLFHWAQREHGVTLLGQFVADSDQSEALIAQLNPAHPAPSIGSTTTGTKLRGFIGLAENFEELRRCVREFPTADGSSVEAPSIAQPSLRVATSRTFHQDILVCGFFDGLADLCQQILLFSPGVSLHIVVSDTHQRSALLSQFTARPSSTSAIEFVPHGDLHIRYQTEDASGQVHLTAGNWADDRELRSCLGPDRQLSQMQCILLTPSTSEADSDARTALALFKLLGLCADQPHEVHPQLSVVCVVGDGDKARRFERKLQRRSADCKTPSVTVVGAERMRNAFLAQSVFVPGIATAYDAMLGCGDQFLQRLYIECTDAGTELIDYNVLRIWLYEQCGVIPLAMELDDGTSVTIVTSPSAQHPSYRFAINQLCAVHGIGPPIAPK